MPCEGNYLVQEIEGELSEAVDGVHRHGSIAGNASDCPEVVGQNAPQTCPLDAAPRFHVDVGYLG